MFRRRPILTAFVIAGLAWAGVAYGAMAEESAMHRAIEAASLHEGPLDMVAYFQPGESGAFVVTATFLAREAPEAQPMRVVMALADGDDVAFAMPGFQEALYRFRRDAGTVTVSVREARPLTGAVAGL
jgi:hypothetical protein